MSNPYLKRLRRQFIVVMMAIVIVFLAAIIGTQYVSSYRNTMESAETALDAALGDMDTISVVSYSTFGIFGVFDGSGMPDVNANDSESTTEDSTASESSTSDNSTSDSSTSGGGAEDSTESSSDSTKPQMSDLPRKGGMIGWNSISSDDDISRTPVLVLLKTMDGSMFIARNDMFFISSLTNDEMIAMAETVEEKVGEIECNNESTDIVKIDEYNMLCKCKGVTSGNVYMAFVDISDEDASLSFLLKRSLLISAAVIVVMFLLSLMLSKIVLQPVAKAWDDQKRFVADASHELKTPLTVIISNADMMTKSDDMNTDKNQRRLDNIRTESERMKELVQELLDIARGDMTDKVLIKEEVNLSELIDTELLSWDPVYFEAGKQLSSVLDDDVYVLGDATKLKRLVSILTDNALKYSAEGGTVEVSLKRDGKSAQLSVSNKGNPMSAQECKDIFERFYRADKSREEVPGYGLGLSIATTVAAEHGGRIWAESDGVDTNYFYVRLPITEKKQ